MADWDISTRAAPTEFDTTSATFNAAITIDSTHVLNIWNGVAGDGFARIAEVDTSTGALTAPGAALEFDTRNLVTQCSLVLIDPTHVLIVWLGGSLGAAQAQVIAINTSTWAVTTAGALLILGFTGQTRMSAVAIDSTHVVYGVGELVSDDGRFQTLAIDTSTWAVTTASGFFTFDTTLGYTFGASVLIDSNKFLHAWGTTGSGAAQVFSVDTSTWAITTAGALFSYGTSSFRYHTLDVIDTTHVLHTFAGAAGSNAWARTLEINTSTWAVTTASSDFNFETGSALYNDFQIIDANHYLGVWTGPASDGFVQSFEVNTSTWAVTTAGALLEFDTNNGQHVTCAAISESQYIIAWTGTDADGFIQLFDVDIPGGAVTFIPIVAMF